MPPIVPRQDKSVLFGMRQPRLKYRLWHVMLLIAVLAGLFAAFGIIGAVAMLAVIGVFVLPVVWAPRGRRLCAAAWGASLYPALLFGSFYATWFMAWCFLGHRPLASRDDPKFISPLVLVPRDAALFLMLAAPFALLACIVLVPACVVQHARREGLRPGQTTARLIIPLVLWLSLIMIPQWDLFDFGSILEWFFD